MLWNRLVLTGTLYEHLHEIETAAQSRIDLMLPKLAADGGRDGGAESRRPDEVDGPDEQPARPQAEEVVLSELIYN